MALFLLGLMMSVAACSTGDDDARTSDSESSSSGAAETEAAGGAESGAVEEREASGDGEVAMAPSSNVADRLIIRTADITMSVQDVPAAISWIRDVATRVGGFVFSTETSSSDDGARAFITIRVPAEDFEAILNQLVEGDLVAEVESQRTTAEDVSDEFIDNEARLESLQRTEDRYLELLGSANSVEDILRIESELTDIRTQIETIQGRQNYLKDATSYATISLNLHLPGTEFQANGGTFVGRVAHSAWDASSNLLEGLLTVVLTLGIVAVVLIPILVAVLFVARAGWRLAGELFSRAG